MNKPTSMNNGRQGDCIDCRYWQCDETTGGDWGRCHKNPPTHDGFPLVHDAAFCGEFSRPPATKFHNDGSVSDEQGGTIWCHDYTKLFVGDEPGYRDGDGDHE